MDKVAKLKWDVFKYYVKRKPKTHIEDVKEHLATLWSLHGERGFRWAYNHKMSTSPEQFEKCLNNYTNEKK